MDRRQLLVGMTAAGLVGKFNPSHLLHAQTRETVNPTSRATIVYPPDTALDEPRGPVKMCVEETNTADGVVSTHITEYSPEGKMTRFRSERDRKLEYSTDDSHHEEVHDAKGRLVKYVSSWRDEPPRETYNTYDDAGRLVTTTNNQNSDRTEYSYGPDGLRTSIQTFDSTTIERTRHAAFCGSAWSAAFLGFGVPSGGTVTIHYDKDDRGTEMVVLTADGQVVTHIVRKYDAVGRVLEEKPLQQNMALLMLDRMPPEQRAAFTPEQIEAWNASMGGKQPSLTTYSYDDEGRFTGKVDRNQFFEEIKTVRWYNDHGDRIEERRTIRENSRMPVGIPHEFDAEGSLVPSQPVAASHRSPLDEDTSTTYSYEYDGYGNWTERTETRNDGFRISTRRILTYY